MIERVCADLGEQFAEVAIDDDPALVERFGEEIPVTFVDGRQHDFWRVDEARLRAALTALSGAAPAEQGDRDSPHASLVPVVPAGPARLGLFSRSQTPTVNGPRRT